MTRLILTTLTLALTLPALACAPDADEKEQTSVAPIAESNLKPPQPIPRIISSLMEPAAYVSPSIDQQILDASIIVVVTFVSVAADVQTIPGDPGVAPTYRPMQVLTFRATEYLKGSGFSEFTVEVRDGSYGVETGGVLYRGYLTREEATVAANQLIAQRNTTFDNRSGVLFLNGPITPASALYGGDSESATKSYKFVLSNQGAQSNFAYSVDTLSRAWLPSKEASSSGATGVVATSEYITDGTKTPPPTLTLSSLKTRIAEIEAMLKAGENIEGYEKCVYHNLIRERWFRADPESRVREIEVTIDSGLAAKSVSLKKEWGDPYYDALVYHGDYHQFWYTGSHPNLFTTVITDNDDVASNGYRYRHTTARPLPKGKYIVNFHLWSASDALCMTKPTSETEDNGYSNWTVNVIAPTGTLHEAFFDPVEAGEYEVSPASFSVGGTATEITGLEWSDGKVVLSLGTYVSLDGYTLDFIGLDGTVSLNLRASDAVEQSKSGDGSGTLKWAVANEPWKDGDKLMLRIREDGATLPPTP